MSQPPESPAPASPWPLRILAATLLLSTVLYVLITFLSRQFAYNHPYALSENLRQRPILIVLEFFGQAFVLYLVALAAAVRCRPDWRLLQTVFFGAVLLRLPILFSDPIQEIDIFRYLWDGAAVTRGVDPYRYSPLQVRDADPSQNLPDDLRRLVELRNSSPAMTDILRTVHHEHLPTIYPPVSQAVFAFCTLLMPDDASVRMRITVTKSVLVAFDLATLMLVVSLLQLAKRHIGWAVAYGWCPLLIKEVANSGHLDAIAVFFATAALFVAARVLYDRDEPVRGWRAAPAAGLSALLLGLGVGAKLYPIVLAPLLLLTCIRRLGFGASSLATIVFSSVVVATLLPMLPSAPPATETAAVQAPGEAQPPSSASPAIERQDPSRGLTTFLKTWEINDLVFMFLIENLRPFKSPSGEDRGQVEPWFSFAPESWRQRIVSPIARGYDVSVDQAASYLTRGITSLVFLIIAMTLAIRRSTAAEPRCWLEAAFLTIAWFWLLSPTQNPWYWCWALPLLPFARSIAWYFFSGTLFIYYTWFWFGYQYYDQPVWGTPYYGEYFFHFIGPWVEFAPLMLWLMLDYADRLIGAGTGERPTRALINSITGPFRSAPQAGKPALES